MNNKKIKNDLGHEIFQKKIEYYQLVPIVSGSASLYFLWKIIFSDLTFNKFIMAIIIVLVVFSISAFLFWSLKRAEQDKDKYLLNIVEKIVEDIFKHYGVAMANKDAASTAREMNPIMQTIVDLVKGLKELMSKTYTKS